MGFQARDNQLKSIPGKIFKTETSRYYKTLVFRNNELESLPDEICGLNFVASLYLDDNRLTSLSKEIGGCGEEGFFSRSSSLTRLTLCNNRHRVPPGSIANLSRNAGVSIDLRDNPLEKRGKKEDGTLGWKDMEKTFGNKVLLSQKSKRKKHPLLRFGGFCGEPRLDLCLAEAADSVEICATAGC